MGIFDYDGFLVKMLTKAGNMMIVSFFWLLSCIPIITIIPATAALFHTTTKVIRQSGTGVLRDYFSHMRSSLRKGIPLSIICIICGLLLYTSLHFGSQIWQNSVFWTLYYVFGFLLAFIYLTMLLFVPPTLSRFECSTLTTLRISLYFASRNLLRSVWYLILLGFMILLVYIYPVTILILPGLYFDLICGGMEKTLNVFMRDQGLINDDEQATSEDSEDKEVESTEEPAELSSLELADLLDEPVEDSINTGDTDE